MRLTRLLTFAEYADMVDEARAKGWYANDTRMFTPGLIFPNPWYFDPLGELVARQKPGWRPTAMIKDRNAPNANFLSPHYWRDWADKRAPYTVVGPNGEWWEIDRRSSNGDGWKVEFTDPLLMTCSPSIVLTGYHGFLRNGEFTPDLEGRGPNGAPRS